MPNTLVGDFARHATKHGGHLPGSHAEERGREIASGGLESPTRTERAINRQAHNRYCHIIHITRSAMNGRINVTVWIGAEKAEV